MWYPIEGWPIIIYCLAIEFAWLAYNMYWSDEDQEVMSVGVILGMVWCIFTSIATFVSGFEMQGLFYLQYIPLFLLCFFGTISFIKYAYSNKLVNYYYVIYAIPVLLSLTLFFL